MPNPNLQTNWRAEDILYGRNGIIRISGTEVANLSSIEARVDVQKSEITLPRRFETLNRRIGWSGSGTLRIYRVNLMFFNTMRKMIDPNQPVPVFDIDMDLENNDPDAGENFQYREIITLVDSKFWSYDWMFNVNDFIEQPLEFTFEGITPSAGRLQTI